ncbi:hypothetical protein L917_05335 [Phytophthora nicotianae]|uniref:NADH:flavin oxidoreductase/NADH oxidase N-terminal domain-containing protein n=2 Tax=Phytophthora nicotianae TaxID=4792 RepID=W2QES0_PHYN3|nr:hypothetical protein PPTG_10250 [Phytophthora nicotianae INRA-310]ETL97384.1 hypothetical protein L917_05335 [Phytophthora nicotianae]ETN11346.1 hypothetical protein PPTG_10250 [Phytophthora nicotianae INRA-310]
MAPLTMLRTGESGVPTDLVTEYYAQRNTPGGLLIAEATNISPTLRVPRIVYPRADRGLEEGHAHGARAGGGDLRAAVACGRDGHTLNQPNGEQPVSSSTIALVDPYSVPRALETHENPGIVADYKRAAEYAIAADFGGVELHGANGYLLEQFLQCKQPHRRVWRQHWEPRQTDTRGGRSCAVQFGLKVAIRMSPYGNTFGCTDSTPEETYSYLIKKLSPFDLA